MEEPETPVVSDPCPFVPRTPVRDSVGVLSPLPPTDRMPISRRDALRYALSAPALIALGVTATPQTASADVPDMMTANVKDFGAIGNGTADDTAAIHAARDAAGVGGKVTFPAGTYLVSNLTASVSNQTWELTDSAVVRSSADATKLLMVTGVGSSVVGGLFDGIAMKPDIRGRKNGIQVGASGVSITRVTVANSPFYGIAAYNCSDIKVLDCTVTNSYVEGIWVQNSLPTPAKNVEVSGNWVDNSSGGDHCGGIGVRGNSANQRILNVRITRNTVRLPYNQTAETGALGATNCTDYIVQNNVLSGGFLGITCPNPTNATISDNVVRGFSYVGIEIPGAVSSVAVERNLVDPDGTSATAGIQASGGSVDSLSLTGNTVKNFSADSYLISFISTSISRRIAIQGNYLTSGGNSAAFTGVYFNDNVTGLTMSKNHVDGSSSATSCGIKFLKSASDVSVGDNLFANLSEAVVLLASSGGGYTLDDIRISGNTVVNCAAVLRDATANGSVVGKNVFT